MGLSNVTVPVYLSGLVENTLRAFAAFIPFPGFVASVRGVPYLPCNQTP